MKRKSAARIILAAGVLVVAWAGAARGQFGPTPVYVEPVQKKTIRRSVELAGTVEARRRSVLGAEVAGRVEKMLADEGDYVRAGQAVCQMRRLPAELQLKQAEGQQVAARAELKKFEGGYRPEEVREAQARASAARAGLEKWELEYARTKRLLADGASTAAEMESVEASYRQAKESLAEAQANLDLVKSGYRAEDVEQARGRAAAQEATVEQLRDTLAKMTIAMPYDGFVVKKHCEAGEWLQAGQPVVEIMDLEVVRLTLDVPERYLGQIAKGAEAPVVFEGLGGKEFMGKVSQVVPLADDATHTAVVRVDIANTVADGRATIAAGFLGRVWVPVGEMHEALLVPKDAVIRQGGQDLVYTLSESPPAGAAAKPETPPTEEAKRQQEAAREGSALIASKSAQYGVKPSPVQFAVAIPVQIVGGYGAWMEVRSEHLSAGMPVVVRGTYLMAPGTAVEVRPKEGQGGGASAEKAGAGE